MLTKQPFGAYAKALLERQHYPDLFEYPGGPPKRPYDVTAHTLPLLFGVDVAHVFGRRAGDGRSVKAIPEPTYTSALSGKSRSASRCSARARRESMDQGWTHWIFDAYKIPYTIITEKDLAAGRSTTGSTRSSSPRVCIGAAVAVAAAVVDGAAAATRPSRRCSPRSTRS